LLNPCGEVAQREDDAGLCCAIPDHAKGRIKCLLLLVLWQLGDFERMADADLIGPSIAAR
jgi:hypothetical protein